MRLKCTLHGPLGGASLGEVTYDTSRRAVSASGLSSVALAKLVGKEIFLYDINELGWIAGLLGSAQHGVYLFTRSSFQPCKLYARDQTQGYVLFDATTSQIAITEAFFGDIGCLTQEGLMYEVTVGGDVSLYSKSQYALRGRVVYKDRMFFLK